MLSSLPASTLPVSLSHFHCPPLQAYIVLNLTADLRSEFSWNTKQLFVYVVRQPPGLGGSSVCGGAWGPAGAACRRTERAHLAKACRRWPAGLTM